MTTKAPTIPRSSRDLTDLDALIDQSIGTQTNIPAVPVASHAGYDASGTTSSTAVLPTQAGEAIELRPGDVPSTTTLERLQVKVPGSVLLAMKVEALKQKRSPSAVVELALRQYLNLPDGT